jgi:hypothetical protein
LTSLTNLRFVEANAVDLSLLGDQRFDLVLNMDGSISGSGTAAERVLGESCRLTRGKLIVTAAHLAWATAARTIGRLTSSALRAFHPAELRSLLERHGMKVLRLGGIGSLAYLCGKEFTQDVLAGAERTEAFLDRCEAFDREVLPDGPGTCDDTGLIAVCEAGSGSPA